MKHKCFFVSFLLLFFLCGCAATKPVNVNLSSISFSADIIYYNECYSCDCNIQSNGNLSVEMTAPENLKGLSVSYSGDTCKVNFNGMVIENANGFLPENSAITVLKDVLEFCNGKECESKNENLILRGNYKGSEYTFSASPSGLPISLEIPEKGIKVTFKNVTVKNQ